MNAEWDDLVLVGRIARAHGNRGQVIVDPATDFPDERFKPGSVLLLRRDGAIERVEVESVRFHRGRPIIGLAGIGTMNAAEALAGMELRVSIDALQSLPAGSYYHHDLIGCSVETARGERQVDGASLRFPRPARVLPPLHHLHLEPGAGELGGDERPAEAGAGHDGAGPLHAGRSARTSARAKRTTSSKVL